MSPTAQFESSGLKNKASKNRKPAGSLKDLMDLNEDLDDLLEGEIDTEKDKVKPVRSSAPKPSRAKQASRPAKGAAPQKKSQRPAVKQSANTTNTKKKTQRSSSRQTTSSRPSSRSRLPQRKSKTHDLKATAAPLLVTVGVLLLIPALWSLLLLAGVGVPGSDREDSRPMAAVMLTCWPIAICLIITAVVFFKQTARAKKEMKLAKLRG